MLTKGDRNILTSPIGLYLFYYLGNTDENQIGGFVQNITFYLRFNYHHFCGDDISLVSVADWVLLQLLLLII